MMRLMVAFAVISVSGCLCAKECKTNDDCGSGQICGSQNLCESTGGGSAGGTSAGGPAGGRAGGTGGGSSGGMTAGGAAGGSMAGGNAGGAPMAGGSAMAGGAGGGATAGGMTAGGTGGGSMCPCAEFQQCVSGRCVNGALTVVMPADGAPHPAGTPLGLAATLTLDGGWPVGLGIPYSTSWGRFGVVPADGGVVLVPGAANAQVGSVVFGWTDGGPGPETRNVSFVACEPAVAASCQPYQRCAPDADGGVCKTFHVALTWTSPTVGVVRGPLVANVAVSLTVAVDGGPMPASVPIRFDGGVVATATQMGTTSTYTAPDIAFSSALAPMDGVQTLTAGWPTSGPSENREFRWDSAPPVLGIRVQPAPPRPTTWPNGTTWRKDEVAQVEVSSTELLSGPATLEVVGAADGGVTRVTDGGCVFAACAQPRCDCFEVDFARIPLNAVTGPVGLTARGMDLASNPASVAESVQVTRVKWQSQVLGLTGPVEPALDGLGNVYVGGASSTTTGVVAQVLRDGTLGWTQSGYGAVTAPVVWSATASLGDAGVFVATRNQTQAQVRALDGVNGGIAGFDVCSIGGASIVYSGRMVSLGATVVTARESGNGLQSVYIADPAGGNCAPSSSPVVAQRATLVGRGIAGGYEIFAASTGNAAFNRLTANAAGTNWVGTIESLSGLVEIASLALGSGRAFMTRSGPGGQGVYAHNLNTASPSQVFALNDGSSVQWTHSTVGQSGAVYFGSPSGPAALYRTVFTAGSPVGSFMPNTDMASKLSQFDGSTVNSFLPAHAPILGHGGFVYMLSAAGDLSVFQNNLRAWFGPNALTLFGNVSVAPLLDVARSAAGAPLCDRPGVLYVVSNAGMVSAFVVDSKGLDRNAAWPRFQHDNANSGNADTNLSTWGCP